MRKYENRTDAEKKAIFELHTVFGQSYSDIARAKGVTRNTISGVIRRYRVEMKPNV